DSDRLLAGLLFRVGYADETVRLGGVTHLVEHLALPVGPIAGADFNGTVDMLTTVMWVAGHRDETLDAIAAVARRLTDPPRAKIPRPDPIAYVGYPSVYPRGFDGGVAVAMECPRAHATSAALRIGIKRLRAQLRAEAGTTYGVDWQYEPLGRDRAHVLIWADCLQADVESTRNRMLGVLEELALSGPTADEL